jgi:hypothetical protein
MKRITLLIFLIPIFQLSAQDYANTKFPSVTIEENETYVFEMDTLLLDTLIMKNNSKINFNKNVFVIIKHSFFGNNVSFNLSGNTGLNGKNGYFNYKSGGNGTEGTDGRNIEIIIQFEELGSFIVNTSGGAGGFGGNGFSPRRNEMVGAQGFDGGDAGMGGNGGNGGIIKFNYRSPNILPLFNSDGKHSITLNSKGGLCGEGGNHGKRGKGGQRELIIQRKTNAEISNVKEGISGQDGVIADNCTDGQEGVIIINKI